MGGELDGMNDSHRMFSFKFNSLRVFLTFADAGKLNF